MRVNSFTIGSFTATGNAHPVNGAFNNIKGFQGLQSPQRRVSSFDLSGQHGALLTSALYGGRILTITVTVYGEDVDDFETQSGLLLSALDLSNGESTLSFTTKGGDSYTVDGVAQLVSDGPAFGELRYGTYTFEFFCSDYRILGSVENSERIYLADTSSGITIPTIVPVSWSGSGGGEATLTNVGNANADCTIVINGPLTASIDIRNITTDQHFQYQSSLAASSNTITITTQNKSGTVVDENGVNRLPNTSSSFRDFIYLAPGANELQFSHDGAYNGDASCVITWHDSYLAL